MDPLPHIPRADEPHGRAFIRIACDWIRVGVGPEGPTSTDALAIRCVVERPHGLTEEHLLDKVVWGQRERHCLDENEIRHEFIVPDDTPLLFRDGALYIGEEAIGRAGP